MPLKKLRERICAAIATVKSGMLGRRTAIAKIFVEKQAELILKNFE